MIHEVDDKPVMLGPTRAWRVRQVKVWLKRVIFSAGQLYDHEHEQVGAPHVCTLEDSDG